MFVPTSKRSEGSKVARKLLRIGRLSLFYKGMDHFCSNVSNEVSASYVHFRSQAANQVCMLARAQNVTLFSLAFQES